MSEQKLKTTNRMIILNIFNFHPLFRNKEFQTGDLVKGLDNLSGMDLIIDINEEPSYTIIGISRENGFVVKKKYNCFEHIKNEVLKKYSINSPEGLGLNKKLKEVGL